MSRDETDARQRLLRWYRRHRRDLPWRRTQDPYRIWVSEIMLQQTRVETVLPYFERFLERFPSLEALARAEAEEVLGAWSGLGYYRRARLLHRAAGQVAADGGELPRDLSGLRALPGIGDYTAAAIGSIAFGLVAPAIDGNVERVVARYRGIDGDPRRGEARRNIRTAAAELIDEDCPGDSNQALMELGATLCRPSRPICSDCPLVADCHARAVGRMEAYPAARGRTVIRRVDRRLAVVRHEGRILLVRRPESSKILPGMWELPWAESGDGTDTESRLGNRYGGRWLMGERFGGVKHAITDRSFDIEVFGFDLEDQGEVAEGRQAGWFAPQDLANLPVSSLVRKALSVAGFGSGALAGGE